MRRVKITSYRRKNGIPLLAWDNKCYNTSIRYATFISHDLFFSDHQPSRPNHLSETTNKELDDRLSIYCGTFKKDFSFCTENVTSMVFSVDLSQFKTVVGSERIFISWKESPPHNSGMLDSRANVAAIGIHTTLYRLKIGKEVFKFYKKTAVYNAILLKRNINSSEVEVKQLNVKKPRRFTEL